MNLRGGQGSLYRKGRQTVQGEDVCQDRGGDQSSLLTVVRVGVASKEGISGYTHLSGSFEK